MQQRHNDTAAADFGNYFTNYHPDGMPAMVAEKDIPLWAKGEHLVTFEFADGPVTLSMPYLERPANMTDAEADEYAERVFVPVAVERLIAALRADMVREAGGDPRLETHQGNA
jgi:hypothetical protein